MKKIILISGASSRLGRRLVESCAKNGYRVYAGIHNKQKLRELAKIWSINIFPMHLDVTNPKSIKIVVRTIFQKEKQIDILINVAGIAEMGSAIEAEDKTFLTMLDINVVGPFRLMKAVAPIMIKRKKGKILNVTSFVGVIAIPYLALYCASKYALEGLGRSMRYELAKYNVWISNISAPSMMEKDKPEQYLYQHSWLRNIILPVYDYNEVNDKIMRFLGKKQPPAQIIMGIQARLFILFQGLFLNTLYDKGFILLANLKSTKPG